MSVFGISATISFPIDQLVYVLLLPTLRDSFDQISAVSIVPLLLIGYSGRWWGIGAGIGNFVVHVILLSLRAGSFIGISRPALPFAAMTIAAAFVGLMADLHLGNNRLVAELKKSISEIKTLQGLIPICASCKEIRDDEGFWQSVEHYIRLNSDAEFTHGLCPECYERSATAAEAEWRTENE